ncbi:MAG: D-2-hydroxyacid dehydrogenase family protein [Betaproteobacteria bacterium]
MSRCAIAIIDDYQDVARTVADWSAVAEHADLRVFTRAWRDEDEIARELAPFAIIVLMRERTAFPARLIARLPILRMIAMTGQRTTTLDIAACTQRGIVVSHTGANPSSAPAEMAFALILACARALPQGHANVLRGQWEYGLPMGIALEGRRLGVVGLGKLGSKVARYGQAFGMDVVAWSQNLTHEAAAVLGVARVDKAELFATADVVSVHLALSPRSVGVIGRQEFALMKPGAIFVNASRGPLADEAALIDALRDGRIIAGLDVFDVEPLPPGHPFTTLPNVVLTPHLGYVVADTMRLFYADSVENILAFLDGAPIRVANPDVLQGARG